MGLVGWDSRFHSNKKSYQSQGMPEVQFALPVCVFDAGNQEVDSPVAHGRALGGCRW